MLIAIIVFIIAMAVLVKSADFFTEYAEKLALELGVSSFIVGVTIASVATSLPELSTSIMAVLTDSGRAASIVAGNVIGSNIANIGLVLGLGAILVTIDIKQNLLKIDLPLLLGASIFLGFTIYDGVFTLSEAILALIGYVIFIKYSFDNKRGDVKKTRKEKVELKTVAILIASTIGIIFGAKYTIISVVEIAKAIMIPEAIIAATLVAVGTSLPELSVTISAISKKKFELGVGNITGSNMFNTFIVMGIPALIKPLPITQEIIYLAFPFMLAMTFLFIIVSQDRHISKYEGAIMLLIYILFVGKIFNLI
ncbi:MAG: calcium/sodium antiporter [Nanoarchaeota archaeon]|nr:calcium/sodium antiporter [Nanoarchaeota archaeon]